MMVDEVKADGCSSWGKDSGSLVLRGHKRSAELVGLRGRWRDEG